MDAFCESPLPADNDLLTSRLLEFGTANGFLSVVAAGMILTTNRKDNLATANSSTSTE